MNPELSPLIEHLKFYFNAQDWAPEFQISLEGLPPSPATPNGAVSVQLYHYDQSIAKTIERARLVGTKFDFGQTGANLSTWAYQLAVAPEVNRPYVTLYFDANDHSINKLRAAILNDLLIQKFPQISIKAELIDHVKWYLRADAKDETQKEQLKKFVHLIKSFGFARTNYQAHLEFTAPCQFTEFAMQNTANNIFSGNWDKLIKIQACAETFEALQDILKEYKPELDAVNHESSCRIL